MAIKWGLIGLGNIAHQFIQDLLLVEKTTCHAVASRSADKAEEFAKRYQVPNAYGSYAALLADPEVDIVYIATPHSTHFEHTLRALQAGKHVLCEKPFAVNANQVKKMVTSAVQQRRFLMEAFWTRFNPSFEYCLELVEQGVLGDVNYINADFTFFRNDPPESRMLNMDYAGGSLLELGVYPLFLAYMLLGKPREVKAVAHFHETGADLQVGILLKSDRGIANLYSGFKSQSDMVAKIYGTKGRIYLEPYWHETQGYELVVGNDGSYQSEKAQLPTKGKGFTYEIEECLQCLQTGKLESLKWSHQHSLDLAKLTDTVRQQIGLQYPFE
ncbi:MAG: Gfo/Idh/MocA family oxidoreductase [Saprospiraceae bacterium]|nr:Gfo/Idh/MocA family oxidoreductase [Saprospiraceae bacterium]